LNISFPATGCQKLIEVDDEKKLRAFYEKRMSQEVSAECLGDEWKVCNMHDANAAINIAQITGKND